MRIRVKAANQNSSVKIISVGKLLAIRWRCFSKMLATCQVTSCNLQAVNRRRLLESNRWTVSDRLPD